METHLGTEDFNNWLKIHLKVERSSASGTKVMKMIFNWQKQKHVVQEFNVKILEEKEQEENLCMIASNGLNQDKN